MLKGCIVLMTSYSFITREMPHITIPGFTIAYQAWGDKELPPLLALHGWLDNCHSFIPLAPYLTKHFYVIAIDLPGHGHSSHLPQGCHYHFIDAIFIIKNIIDALGIKQIHLLGHSMGGCLASLVAGVIPEAILSLALIEALGPFSSPEHTCQAQLNHFLQHELTKQLEQRGRPYSSLESAAQARANGGYLPMEFARLLCERGVEERDGYFFWRHDRRLQSATPLRMTELQILSCLETITAHTCLIWAKQGFNFDEQLVEKRIMSIQHIRVHYLDGGHHLHMEQPLALSSCLNDFYSDLT